MRKEFDPRSMSGEMGDIIATNDITVDIDDALEEIEPVVDELSEDISGVGQKAAERYLLRYEYGVATNELASEFDVSPQTISNQVSAVRAKVLKYPRLARIIGTLRAHRADLSQPDYEDGHTWEGEAHLSGEAIEYRVEFKSGSAGRPYSWCYSCESRYEEDGKRFHLFEDYLVDAIHGVFLKRLIPAFSRKSWHRPPRVREYNFNSYALPNAEISNNRNGTLLDAVEYHWSYDTKNQFENLVTGNTQWNDMVVRAEHDEDPLPGSAHYAQEDVLSERIRNCDSPSAAIEEYSETVHIRNNIERLMRIYPLDAPFDLPYETVTQLWNGQPCDRPDHENTWLVAKQDLYALAKNAYGRHSGRDVRVKGNKHDISFAIWR